METKLVRVPFDVEMAKRIHNGDCEGKIVTRGRMRVRVLCFDKIGNESIVALVYEETDNKETCIIYLNDGTIPNCKQTRFDLMLEVPEYLTFKDGDVISSGDDVLILKKIVNRWLKSMWALQEHRCRPHSRQKQFPILSIRSPIP